jgi:hypothetical protein
VSRTHRHPLAGLHVNCPSQFITLMRLKFEIFLKVFCAAGGELAAFPGAGYGITLCRSQHSRQEANRSQSCMTLQSSGAASMAAA